MQTSIEWFIEHLLGSGLLRLTKEEHRLYSELRDKAKEINKQEIIMSYHIGYSDAIQCNPKQYNPEQYYSETFKKN